MRRLLVIMTVLLLGVAPLVIPGLPAAAQDKDSDFQLGPNHGDWAEVARPEPREGLGTSIDGQRLQPYDVYFNMPYAAVPRIDEAETMVVEIQAGAFALEVLNMGTFIVNRPGGSPIEFLEILPDEPYYLPTATYVRDVNSNICTHMCAIPLEHAIQLEPGDVTFATGGSVCIWCLLNQAGKTDQTGLMLVSAVLDQEPERLESFSWVQSWEQWQGAGNATPEQSAQSPVDGRRVALAWAFNPQARCKP